MNVQTSQNDILSILEGQAAGRGDAAAFVMEDGTYLTYAEAFETATRIAAALSTVHPGKGRRRPRIGLVLPNGGRMAVALLGAAIAGEATPFNPVCKAAEYDAYFRSTKIDALVVGADEDGPAVMIAERQNLRLLRLSSRMEIAGLEAGSGETTRPLADDVALVLMTSGSTGRPKIVPLTHGNVCTSARDVARSMNLSPEDRCLSMWEQHHIGGLVDLLLAPLASGGSIVETTGFNAARFFELLATQQPTWFQGVPTTLNELVIHAGANQVAAKPSSLRLLRSVAAALQPRVMSDLEELFGVPVIQTFGMTEAGPLITSTALPPAVRKPGSVGRSCGTSIRIVGPDGKDVPTGEQGEVEIRGANVFRGYENDPDANETQFRDGWFHTGDIAYLDGDGDLFLTGRIKQLINRGGEKINPQEVDDVLASFPAVSEAACFSVKHSTLGEDIVAAVVLREPAEVDQIRAHLSAQLAAFKVPRRILILDRLPRNPVGKIDRLALSEIAESSGASGGGHAAPRNPLETYLAGLWSRELGAPEVGIHDDFGMLGGDSLSSMRVLVAIETALGRTLPDDIIASFTTVAALAEGLSKIGVVTDWTGGGAAEAVDKGEATGTGSAPLDSAASEAAGRQRMEDALKRADASRNRVEFLAALDTITLYCTPVELQSFMKRLGGLESFLGSLAKLGPSAAVRSHVARARWRREVQREFDTAERPMSWRRVEMTPGCFLYENPSIPSDRKQLIVGFTGRYLRLMLPTYRILCALPPDRFDLLLLRDPDQRFFMDGLPGMGEDIDTLVDHVDEFARERGYGKTIAIGTSGGGIPAIYAALKAGWPIVSAVAPASLARYPQVAAKMTSIAERGAAGTEVIVAYSSGSARDVDAAMQVKAVLPSARLAADDRFEIHNLLDRLYNAGELTGFFTGLAD